MKLCLACGKTFLTSDWQCPSCGRRTERQGGFLSFAPEFSGENDLYPASGFERLAPLEERNFWFRSRNELIAWGARKWLAAEGKFLEIGCGTGFVLSRMEREFPRLECFGSEIYGTGLVYASKRLKRTELFQMDARHIPFQDEFNAIGLFDTLEHIPDDEGVLAQIHQALAPGGSVILTVPQHAFLWSYVDEYTHHARRYERKDLGQKLEKAGFDLVMATSFISFLLPLMWLSRMRQGKPTADFDPEAEFKIHPWLNLVLEKVLTVERFFIRMGFRLPWGGSLLMIARKA
jgi:SAM-dependent methyltransferase